MHTRAYGPVMTDAMANGTIGFIPAEGGRCCEVPRGIATGRHAVE